MLLAACAARPVAAPLLTRLPDVAQGRIIAERSLPPRSFREPVLMALGDDATGNQTGWEMTVRRDDGTLAVLVAHRAARIGSNIVIPAE